MNQPVESKTRTHYGPVGSGRRMAGRRGGAGLGRTGRRRVDPARRQPSLLPSSESKTMSWTFLRKNEQTKSHVNRMREQNHRLPTGLSAVYPRLISGTAIALRSWLLTSVPTPICLCKPCSCKACPRKEIVESKTRTYHGRFGSGRPADGGAGGVGLGANRIDRPGDKGPSYLPGHRRHVA